MMKNKTLVIGASLNPARYSNKAIQLLQEKGIPHIALGLRAGNIGNTTIETERKAFGQIDTISLYIGEKHQGQKFQNYLINLAPRRVIFNPGSESHDTIKALRAAGIAIEMSCTLVLLRTDQYQN